MINTNVQSFRSIDLNLKTIEAFQFFVTLLDALTGYFHQNNNYSKVFFSFYFLVIMHILGDISIQDFFQQYWQKKPLLVRNAFENFKPLLSAQELAGLSVELEIESRLVIENAGKWSLQKGPFSEEDYNQLPKDKWTLLVQAVDHWVPEAAAFLDHFSFIPTWRCDDLMISYATAGGGVGPHYDQYDVFLIQAEGQREWRIGQDCSGTNAVLVDGADLKVLENFEEQQRWLLNPGDMLYIPPAIAHWGVAKGDCQTYSVGFRAPAVSDMLDRSLDELLPLLSESQRYKDADALIERNNPAEISQQNIATIKSLLIERLDNDAAIASMFGTLMTETKYPEYAPQLIELEENDRLEESWQVLVEQFTLLSANGPLHRDGHARFSYFSVPNDEVVLFFCQGEKYEFGIEDKPLINLLANHRHYDAKELLEQVNSEKGKQLLSMLWFSELIYN